MQISQTVAKRVLTVALMLGVPGIVYADGVPDNFGDFVAKMMQECEHNPSDILHTNVAALLSAYPVVMGDPASVSCLNVQNWGAQISGPPYNMSAEWNQGLKFTDAVKFLKMELAQPGFAGFRAHTIENAFMEVYGRKSTPIEQAQWDTQFKNRTAWYATMVNAEIKRLAADPVQRQEMIDRVYRTSMGRAAAPGERSYWLPRSEHYRLIVEASRKWLYSPNGAKDLVETVTRALTAKMGRPPTDDQIKSAMAQFTNQRAIYSDMVSPLQNFHPFG